MSCVRGECVAYAFVMCFPFSVLKNTFVVKWVIRLKYVAG